MQTAKFTLISQKEIIAGSRRIITKFGSEHLTLTKLAEEIDVPGAVIHLHFPNRKAILSFMIDDVKNNLLADLDKMGHEKLSSVAILKKNLMGIIGGIEQREGVDFQIMAEIISLGDRKLSQKMQYVVDQYLDRIKRILAEGVKTGVIRPGLNLESTACLFFNLVQGVVNLWVLSRYSFNLKREATSLCQVFLAAVVNGKC